MYNPFSLQGKTILITGASSGIGRATAIECSKMGATLVITGRNKERLQETFMQLEGEGHQQIIGDLTTEETIKEIATFCPVLQGVLFCAGISDTTVTKFLTSEKFLNILHINLISPVLLTRYLLANKKIQKGASLVYISSMGATHLAPGLGIYGASKGGLNSMVKAFAIELAPRNIRANAIMPAMVKTELLGTLDTITAEDWEKDEAKYPLGYGKPSDIAYAAIYLFSDASRWITGTELQMDGGRHLQ